MNCKICSGECTDLNEAWERCKKCGVYQSKTWKIPSKDSPVSLPPDRVAKGVLRFKRFASLLASPGITSVYDALCGCGQFLFLASFHTREVSGCDIKKEACDKAFEYYGVNVENEMFEKCRMDKMYDFILFHHGIEHTESPSYCLQKAWSNVLPGGLLLLAHPAVTKERTPEGGHNFEWTFEDFRNLIYHHIPESQVDPLKTAHLDGGGTQEHWMWKAVGR